MSNSLVLTKKTKNKSFKAKTLAKLLLATSSIGLIVTSNAAYGVERIARPAALVGNEIYTEMADMWVADAPPQNNDIINVNRDNMVFKVNAPIQNLSIKPNGHVVNLMIEQAENDLGVVSLSNIIGAPIVRLHILEIKDRVSNRRLVVNANDLSGVSELFLEKEVVFTQPIELNANIIIDKSGSGIVAKHNITFNNKVGGVHDFAYNPILHDNGRDPARNPERDGAGQPIPVVQDGRLSYLAIDPNNRATLKHDANIENVVLQNNSTLIIDPSLRNIEARTSINYNNGDQESQDSIRQALVLENLADNQGKLEIKGDAVNTVNIVGYIGDLGKRISSISIEDGESTTFNQDVFVKDSSVGDNKVKFRGDNLVMSSRNDITEEGMDKLESVITDLIDKELKDAGAFAAAIAIKNASYLAATVEARDHFAGRPLDVERANNELLAKREFEYQVAVRKAALGGPPAVYDPLPSDVEINARAVKFREAEINQKEGVSKFKADNKMRADMRVIKEPVYEAEKAVGGRLHNFVGDFEEIAANNWNEAANDDTLGTLKFTADGSVSLKNNVLGNIVSTIGNNGTIIIDGNTKFTGRFQQKWNGAVAVDVNGSLKALTFNGDHTLAISEHALIGKSQIKLINTKKDNEGTLILAGGNRDLDRKIAAANKKLKNISFSSTNARITLSNSNVYTNNFTLMSDDQEFTVNDKVTLRGKIKGSGKVKFAGGNQVNWELGADGANLKLIEAGKGAVKFNQQIFIDKLSTNGTSLVTIGNRDSKITKIHLADKNARVRFEDGSAYPVKIESAQNGWGNIEFNGGGEVGEIGADGMSANSLVFTGNVARNLNGNIYADNITFDGGALNTGNNLITINGVINVLPAGWVRDVGNTLITQAAQDARVAALAAQQAQQLAQQQAQQAEALRVEAARVEAVRVEAVRVEAQAQQEALLAQQAQVDRVAREDAARRQVADQQAQQAEAARRQQLADQQEVARRQAEAQQAQALQAQQAEAAARLAEVARVAREDEVRQQAAVQQEAQRKQVEAQKAKELADQKAQQEATQKAKQLADQKAESQRKQLAQAESQRRQLAQAEAHRKQLAEAQAQRTQQLEKERVEAEKELIAAQREAAREIGKVGAQQAAAKVIAAQQKKAQIAAAKADAARTANKQIIESETKIAEVQNDINKLVISVSNENKKEMIKIVKEVINNDASSKQEISVEMKEVFADIFVKKDDNVSNSDISMASLVTESGRQETINELSKPILDGSKEILEVAKSLDIVGIDLKAHAHIGANDSVLNTTSKAEQALLFVATMQNVAPSERKEALKQIQTSIENSANISAHQAVTGRMDSVTNMQAIGIASGEGVASGDEDDLTVQKGVWISGLYGKSKQSGSKGYDGKLVGASVGFDLNINDDSTVIGLAYTNAGSDFKYKTKSSSKAKVRSHVMSVYGQQEINQNWLLSGIFSFSNSGVNTKMVRNIATANGKFKNNSYSMEGSLGYKLPVAENISLLPQAGLRYSKYSDGAYTETGAGVQNISVASKSGSQLTGIIGGKILMKQKLSETLDIIPILHANVESNLKSKQTKARGKFVWSDNYFESEFTEKPAKLAFNAGVSIVAKMNNLEVSSSYNLHAHKKFQSHQGSLKLKVMF